MNPPRTLTVELVNGDVLAWETRTRVNIKKVSRAIGRVQKLAAYDARCTYDLNDREKKFFNRVCDDLEKIHKKAKAVESEERAKKAAERVEEWKKAHAEFEPGADETP